MLVQPLLPPNPWKYNFPCWFCFLGEWQPALSTFYSIGGSSFKWFQAVFSPSDESGMSLDKSHPIATPWCLQVFPWTSQGTWSQIYCKTTKTIYTYNLDFIHIFLYIHISSTCYRLTYVNVWSLFILAFFAKKQETQWKKQKDCRTQPETRGL